MKEIVAQMVDDLQRLMPTDRLLDTSIPGVYCVRAPRLDQCVSRHWRASIGFPLQGVRELVLGGEVYRADPGRYIATMVNLPLVGRIVEVTPERPFLAMQVEIDPVMLREVESQLPPLTEAEGGLRRAVFVTQASERMLEAAARLARLVPHSGEAAVVGPLVIRELYYHLLTGAEGPEIRRFVRSGDKTYQIARAIYRIRAHLAEGLDTETLAAEAGMGRTLFFRSFKEVTSMSPIQYQKKLRLIEAQRLMIEERDTAESAAYRVGYSSPSQFSREYTRLFGQAPHRDVRKRPSGPSLW